MEIKTEPHEFIKPPAWSAKPGSICELCSQPAGAAVHQVAPCAEIEPCAEPPRTTPPDQHVAPPRIWIEGTPSGRWLVWLDGQARGLEYLAAAPIQAALEACEAHLIKDDEGSVMVYIADWDALVASVKGST
jgi:hypothetical protein